MEPCWAPRCQQWPSCNHQCLTGACLEISWYRYMKKSDTCFTEGVEKSTEFINVINQVLGLSVCWLCDSIISLTLGMVSVDFFDYRFKPIPWILSYKWADYWPYLEFIYLIFFYEAFCCYVYYHGLFVSCLGWCGCWAFFFLCCDKYLY